MFFSSRLAKAYTSLSSSVGSLKNRATHLFDSAKVTIAALSHRFCCNSKASSSEKINFITWRIPNKSPDHTARKNSQSASYSPYSNSTLPNQNFAADSSRNRSLEQQDTNLFAYLTPAEDEAFTPSLDLRALPTYEEAMTMPPLYTENPTPYPKAGNLSPGFQETKDAPPTYEEAMTMPPLYTENSTPYPKADNPSPDFQETEDALPIPPKRNESLSSRPSELLHTLQETDIEQTKQNPRAVSPAYKDFQRTSAAVKTYLLEAKNLCESEHKDGKTASILASSLKRNIECLNKRLQEVPRRLEEKPGTTQQQKDAVQAHLDIWMKYSTKVLNLVRSAGFAQEWRANDDLHNASFALDRLTYNQKFPYMG